MGKPTYQETLERSAINSAEAIEAVLLSGKNADSTPFSVLVDPRDAFGRVRTSDPETHTTRRPILTIRPSATFNSITNRALVILDSLDITAATNSAYWELVYGGTLTNANFGSAGTTSTMDVDVAATAITNGHTIQSGYVTAGAGATRQSIRNGIASRLPLTLDAAGQNPINLSVVVTSMTGTASVAAALNWRSLR